jgi:hypothetical protein
LEWLSPGSGACSGTSQPCSACCESPVRTTACHSPESITERWFPSWRRTIPWSTGPESLWLLRRGQWFVAFCSAAAWSPACSFPSLGTTVIPANRLWLLSCPPPMSSLRDNGLDMSLRSRLPCSRCGSVSRTLVLHVRISSDVRKHGVDAASRPSSDRSPLSLCQLCHSVTRQPRFSIPLGYLRLVEY